MISPRLNWPLLVGEFVVIVVGVLMALWVDELRQARYDAALEIEYVESLVTDLEADLAQFDEVEAWMSRSEAAAATVLALYEGSPPTENSADLVEAVETAGWQAWPVITRNTIEDLSSTGNIRLIRDNSLRRAIAAYYTLIENVSIPNANMRERIWAGYDARAVVSQARYRDDRLSRWVTDIAQRSHPNVAAVALANKTARMAWAMLRHKTDYDPALAAR